MNKENDSKNIAICALQKGEGIALLGSNGRECLYPAGFLKNSAEKYPTSQNQIAIKLAKMAGILPIMLKIPESEAPKNWQEFSEEVLSKELEQDPQIIEVSRANLPIHGSENSKIIAFRSLADGVVHLSLIVGGEVVENPLVLVHSSCVTADLLGSLRCDCCNQLALALDAMKKEGAGILLYLNQEGRGIGIANKVKAYSLQEQGLNTYQANNALGFEDDERDFRAAKEILHLLGVRKIRLLSNNPHKLAALQHLGINISERVPVVSTPHAHNEAYLSAKQGAGHII